MDHQATVATPLSLNNLEWPLKATQSPRAYRWTIPRLIKHVACRLTSLQRLSWKLPRHICWVLYLRHCWWSHIEALLWLGSNHTYNNYKSNVVTQKPWNTSASTKWFVSDSWALCPSIFWKIFISKHESWRKVKYCEKQASVNQPIKLHNLNIAYNSARMVMI